MVFGAIAGSVDECLDRPWRESEGSGAKGARAGLGSNGVRGATGLGSEGARELRGIGLGAGIEDSGEALTVAVNTILYTFLYTFRGLTGSP